MAEIDYSYAYFKMLFVLTSIIILLYLIKKFIEKKNLHPLGNTHEIKVVSQKMLDTKNKITLIECRGKAYLLMIGEKSFLIDKYDNFEKIIQEKKDENIDNN